MSTYSDRPDLSKELDEKLARQHTASPRAVAVIGLGGTGKTQLVLHHIEGHEAEYDTVLWIDARDKETARASFERCCRDLSLPVEPSPDDRPLQDVPCVQRVLSLLRARAEDKKWLTVIDNADDLSWGVGNVFPRGKAGTVLVTSQDGHASGLLGGRMPTINVDAMQPEEAVRLIANRLNKPVSRGDDCWDLIEKITVCLDRLALPLDLAGARISVDAETWGDLAAALKQYLEDYQYNEEKLLHDTEYADTTPYKKTVWTAWETSLSSLKAKEGSQSDIYPVQLLTFLTLFDRANVQDELFRLASLGIDVACAQLDVTIPSWLRKLLEKDGNKRWDSLSYRNTILCLLRYGLVRPIVVPWKGVTMHGLVQRRAQQELQPGYLRLRLIFLFAICVEVNSVDHVRFRRHLPVHLPSSDAIPTGPPLLSTERQTAHVWYVISKVYHNEGNLQESTQIKVKAVAVLRTAFGDEDLQTLEAMSNLAFNFLAQGLTDESKNLILEVIRLREAALGTMHPDTLRSRHILASILQLMRHPEESANQCMAILEARRAVLGNDHSDTIQSMHALSIAYRDLGKYSRAGELLVEVLETSERLSGRAHQDTIESMKGLAYVYQLQGKHQESFELQLKATQTARDVFGDDHEKTLTNMERLAWCYVSLGRLTEGEELQIEIVQRSGHQYGSNHPITLGHMIDLATTRSRQGKLVEAEKMQIEVLEEMTRVYGEEHRNTLEIMAYLAVTLQYQRRWKDAEDLGSKTVANSSRALGDSHPLTLFATAKLALSKRALGQDDVAIDLMRRSAVVSSEVLGDNHPVTKNRHEHAAKWAEEDSVRIPDAKDKTVEDGSVGVARNLRSMQGYDTRSRRGLSASSHGAVLGTRSERPLFQ